MANYNCEYCGTKSSSICSLTTNSHMFFFYKFVIDYKFIIGYCANAQAETEKPMSR